MESQSLYSASFGLENGSGGGEYDFQRQQLEGHGGVYFGRYPLVDQWLRGTGFYHLIYRWGGPFQIRRGTINNRARSISDHNRCLTVVITTVMAPGTITNSHIPLAAASQPLNLSLLSAAGSASNPNLPSDNHRSFSPGTGHFRRASLGLRSDRGAELRGTLGTQGTLTTPQRMSINESLS